MHGDGGPGKHRNMKKILIADDEAPMRMVMRALLEDGDYEVLEAGDGNEAIRIVEDNAPDLLITDILMPGKAGIETIKELRQDHPNLRIIAMSGGGRIGSQDVLTIAHSLDIAGTLQKPFGADDLVNLVAKALSEEG